MVLLIKNAHVYAPQDLGINDILIINDKIVAVEQKMEILIPGLEILDADGAVCIPGLIDQHVHVTGGGGEGGFATRVPEIRLSDCIKAGVTSLVGLLGTDSRTRTVENLVAKIKGLKAEGLSAWCLTGAYEYPSPTITGNVSKDIVYIEEILGVKIALSDHRSSNMSREDMIHLASEARIAGLLSGKPGIVHIHTGKGKNKLRMIIDICKNTDIPAFVFRPTHMREDLMEDMMELARMGTWLDFTTGEHPEKTADLMIRAMRRLPEEKMTMSSDSNGSMPIWNEQHEMIGMGVGSISTLFQTVVELTGKGLPLEKALSFCTVNVARALNLHPVKGCIASGADADVVLLDGPDGIDTVIARGNIMMKHKKILRVGTFDNI